jgi:nucleoside-diphosphate-sugar epimerase
MDTVFITGASGYIGAEVASAFRAEGYAVAGLVRSDASATATADRGVRVVRGDLRDPATFRDAVRAADVVIHTGATNDADFPTVDQAAVEDMLRTLTGTGKTFIYTSGSWVLGSTGDAGGDEDSTPDPLPMVAFRAGLEQRIRAAKDAGVRTMIIRPGFVYGHGRGIVAGFVRQAVQDRVVRYVGAGLNRVSLVHIADLATLYVLAAKRGTAGATYHGVSGASLTYRDLARSVAALADLPKEKVESWPVDQARTVLGWYADGFLMDQNLRSDKTQAALGWIPARSYVTEELAKESESAGRA